MRGPLRIILRLTENVTNAHTDLQGVPIDETVIADADALGIDVVRACEAGLCAEIKRAADACWIEENRPAMETSNRRVEEHGLPLARYRRC